MNRTPSVFFVLMAGGAVALAPTLAGCDDRDGLYGLEDDEIVFGITQEVGEGGAVTTSAGWEMLSLGGRGWSTLARLDPDRACYLEATGTRLGTPYVDSGLARFGGPKLPTGALLVDAKAPGGGEAKADGAGWSTGDALTFESRGFAIPDVPPIQLDAPPTELAITAPAPGELAVSREADLVVTWDPALPGGGHASGARDGDDGVMAVLDVDAGAAGAGSPPVELRCFFDRAAGTGSVPHELIAAMAPRPRDGQGGAAAGGAQAAAPELRGTLVIGTHSQVSFFDGDWLVYVVAGVHHRAQPFVVRD
jgi:hypothetical protein